VRTLASALVSGTTPGHSRWVGLRRGRWTIEDELDDDAKVWLDERPRSSGRTSTTRTSTRCTSSAKSTAASPGWFYLFVDEDEEGGYAFEQWAVARVGGGIEAWRPLDTFHREVQLTAEQCVSSTARRWCRRACARRRSSRPTSS
jgi:hypothetical protein